MKEQIGEFFLSLQPLLKKYTIEIGLIFIAGALAIGAIFFFRISSPSRRSDNFIRRETKPPPEEIMVDLEGAATKAGPYTLAKGSRLNDLLEKAGGLSEDADKDFFKKNFNRAEILEDQQKIYIPSTQEITSGDFTAQSTTSFQSSPNSSTSDQNSTIGINSASAAELDSLPGIGTTTAQKIIDSRPYSTIQELLEKKIVKSNVFDQIKDKLTLE